MEGGPTLPASSQPRDVQVALAEGHRLRAEAQELGSRLDELKTWLNAFLVRPPADTKSSQLEAAAVLSRDLEAALTSFRTWEEALVGGIADTERPASAGSVVSILVNGVDSHPFNRLKAAVGAGEAQLVEVRSLPARINVFRAESVKPAAAPAAPVILGRMAQVLRPKIVRAAAGVTTAPAALAGVPDAEPASAPQARSGPAPATTRGGAAPDEFADLKRSR